MFTTDVARYREGAKIYNKSTQRQAAQHQRSRLPPCNEHPCAPPTPPRPPPKREADPLECARTTHTSVRHPVPAKGRQLPAIGGATGAPAIVTGGDKRGGRGGGVRCSCRHGGGRVPDRRLLYRLQIQFNLLADLL